MPCCSLFRKIESDVTNATPSTPRPAIGAKHLQPPRQQPQRPHSASLQPPPPDVPCPSNCMAGGGGGGGRAGCARPMATAALAVLPNGHPWCRTSTRRGYNSRQQRPSRSAVGAARQSGCCRRRRRPRGWWSILRGAIAQREQPVSPGRPGRCPARGLPSSIDGHTSATVTVIVRPNVAFYYDTAIIYNYITTGMTAVQLYSCIHRNIELLVNLVARELLPCRQHAAFSAVRPARSGCAGDRGHAARDQNLRSKPAFSSPEYEGAPPLTAGVSGASILLQRGLSVSSAATSQAFPRRHAGGRGRQEEEVEEEQRRRRRRQQLEAQVRAARRAAEDGAADRPEQEAPRVRALPAGESSGTVFLLCFHCLSS
eukprot:SAG22_NODE_710_length_7741_cov_108.460089_9_plen_370_part_00